MLFMLYIGPCLGLCLSLDILIYYFGMDVIATHVCGSSGIRSCFISFAHMTCCNPPLGTILLKTTARPLWVRVLLLSMPGYYVSLVHIVMIIVTYDFFSYCLSLLNQCP